MKKTKIIIPALGLLLLSTAASVTGTVAWFASQATVTATGMSVTAKADSAFLLIKAGSATAAQVQSTGSDEASAVTDEAELLPVAHTDSVTNITTADAYANWFYKYSDDPSLYGGQGHETAATALTSSNYSNYVLRNEFTLTVAEGSQDMNALRVGTCTITTAGDQAVKVLVASDSACQEFSGQGGNGSVVLQNSLTDATTMSVKIYIYWDGEDEDLNTNNFASLLETEVEVTFTGNVGTYVAQP